MQNEERVDQADPARSQPSVGSPIVDRLEVSAFLDKVSVLSPDKLCPCQTNFYAPPTSTSMLSNEDAVTRGKKNKEGIDWDDLEDFRIRVVYDDTSKARYRGCQITIDWVDRVGLQYWVRTEFKGKDIDRKVTLFKTDLLSILGPKDAHYYVEARLRHLGPQIRPAPSCG
jgi:hypothetical protein